MTLKTLKDFENISKEHSHNWDDCCREEGVETLLFELQKEAKEWIKELQGGEGRYCLICRKRNCSIHECDSDDVLNEQDPYEPKGREESIKWIKHFFNIQESELE